MIAIFALLAHWGAGFLAYFFARAQYGEKLAIQGKSGSIDVRALYAPRAGRHLKLNWESVAAGVESLVTQMDELKGGGVDFCIGVNNAGSAVASLLAGFLGRQNPLPVYVVITKGRDRNMDGLAHCLPEKEHATILVVDMMTRSGRNVKAIVELLKKKYGNDARILVATVTIMKRGCQLHDIWEIRKGRKLGGYCEQEDSYLPDYVAFLSQSPVRFPGLGQ